MGRKRIGVGEVIRVMDQVIEHYPADSDARIDRSRLLGGRYAEHGEPCCLVGVMLIRFGASVATLKDLDREDEEISDSKHPYWKRFDPVALSLLAFLQRQNDGGASWTRTRELAFSPNTYWQSWLKPGDRLYQERVYPGLWCTDENARYWEKEKNDD